MFATVNGHIVGGPLEVGFYTTHAHLGDQQAPLCCIVDGTVRCVKKTFSALRRYVASPQRAAAPLYEVRKEGLQYWQGENSECAPRGGMAPIGRRGGQPARSATTGVNLITPLAGALQKYAIL